MNYLPTDNLYKFCAIAGLIIMGFSVYYPFQLSTMLRSDVTDVSTDLDVLAAEIHYSESRLKRLNKETGFKEAIQPDPAGKG